MALISFDNISRASHEATLFTDDLAKLGPQLAADVSKTSAPEISQPSSIAQGIGLGAVKMLTLGIAESSPFISVWQCLSSYRNRGRYAVICMKR
jgi:hypothetical protein